MDIGGVTVERAHAVRESGIGAGVLGAAAATTVGHPQLELDPRVGRQLDGARASGIPRGVVQHPRRAVVEVQVDVVVVVLKERPRGGRAVRNVGVAGVELTGEDPHRVPSVIGRLRLVEVQRDRRLGIRNGLARCTPGNLPVIETFPVTQSSLKPEVTTGHLDRPEVGGERRSGHRENPLLSPEDVVRTQTHRARNLLDSERSGPRLGKGDIAAEIRAELVCHGQISIRDNRG